MSDAPQVEPTRLMLSTSAESAERKVELSVLMLTYNHQEFIEQSIRSVLEQQCRFPFKIVVGDDASTDGTLSKLELLQGEYPEIIQVLPSVSNLGITANFVRTLEACRGTYIAILEGDDYWIDPLKLQDQVDQLESDKTLSLSAGRTRNRTFHGLLRTRYTQLDLLRRYLFHTSTLVFRRTDANGLQILPNILALDTLLIAHLMTRGDCALVDREVSYYRRHEGGSWSSLDCVRQISNTQDVTDALSKQFSGRYDAALRDRELWIYTMMMQMSVSQPVLRQWKSRWPLMKPLVIRIFRFYPLPAFRQMIRLLILPVGAGVLRLRKTLGIGTLLRGRLKSENAVSSTGGSGGEKQ